MIIKLLESLSYPIQRLIRFWTERRGSRRILYALVLVVSISFINKRMQINKMIFYKIPYTYTSELVLKDTSELASKELGFFRDNKCKRQDNEVIEQDYSQEKEKERLEDGDRNDNSRSKLEKLEVEDPEIPAKNATQNKPKDSFWHIYLGWVNLTNAQRVMALYGSYYFGRNFILPYARPFLRILPYIGPWFAPSATPGPILSLPAPGPENNPNNISLTIQDAGPSRSIPSALPDTSEIGSRYENIQNMVRLQFSASPMDHIFSIQTESTSVLNYVALALDKAPLLDSVDRAIWLKYGIFLWERMSRAWGDRLICKKVLRAIEDSTNPPANEAVVLEEIRLMDDTIALLSDTGMIFTKFQERITNRTSRLRNVKESFEKIRDKIPPILKAFLERVRAIGIDLDPDNEIGLFFPDN